VVASTQSPVCK